jgi:hypothetical protein
MTDTMHSASAAAAAAAATTLVKQLRCTASAGQLMAQLARCCCCLHLVWVALASCARRTAVQLPTLLHLNINCDQETQPHDWKIAQAADSCTSPGRLVVLRPQAPVRPRHLPLSLHFENTRSRCADSCLISSSHRPSFAAEMHFCRKTDPVVSANAVLTCGSTGTAAPAAPVS